MKQFKQDEKYWTKFSSIQLIPIARKNMGSSIAFTFVAPMVKKKEKEIVLKTPIKSTDEVAEKKREKSVIKSVVSMNPWGKMKQKTAFEKKEDEIVNEFQNFYKEFMYMKKTTYIAAKKNEDDENYMSLKPKSNINKNYKTFDYAHSTYLDDVIYDFK